MCGLTHSALSLNISREDRGLWAVTFTASPLSTCIFLSSRIYQYNGWISHTLLLHKLYHLLSVCGPTFLLWPTSKIKNLSLSSCRFPQSPGTPYKISYILPFSTELFKDRLYVLSSVGSLLSFFKTVCNLLEAVDQFQAIYQFTEIIYKILCSCI